MTLQIQLETARNIHLPVDRLLTQEISITTDTPKLEVLDYIESSPPLPEILDYIESSDVESNARSVDSIVRNANFVAF